MYVNFSVTMQGRRHISTLIFLLGCSVLPLLRVHIHPLQLGRNSHTAILVNHNQSFNKFKESDAKEPQRNRRVAFLFKLHTLDSSVRSRLRHLEHDIIHIPRFLRMTSSERNLAAPLFIYDLVVCFDENLVNGTELEELQAFRHRVNRDSSNLLASSISIESHPRVSLFPFTGQNMHQRYPTQYPKSNWQAPLRKRKEIKRHMRVAQNTTEKAVEVMDDEDQEKDEEAKKFKSMYAARHKHPFEARLRHITHDNPEMAYLLWWSHQRQHKQRYEWVWGCEYDVAMLSSTWMLSKAATSDDWLGRGDDRINASTFKYGHVIPSPWLHFLEATASETATVDLMGTMVGERPWDTWTLGGRINFARPGDNNDVGSGGDIRRKNAEGGQADRRVAMYSPLVRYSPFALDIIDAGYRGGRIGYVEVAQSTLCHVTDGCILGEIPLRFRGHFDYRPVVHPSVFEEIAVLAGSQVKLPLHANASLLDGKLFHPVKFSRPLSSILLDAVFDERAANTASRHSSITPRVDSGRLTYLHDNNTDLRLSNANARFTVGSIARAEMLRSPRTFKPTEYFVSQKHVPWASASQKNK